MALAKDDAALDLENGLAAASCDMHVDGCVVVAVEKETKSISFEYGGHRSQSTDFA